MNGETGCLCVNIPGCTSRSGPCSVGDSAICGEVCNDIDAILGAFCSGTLSSFLGTCVANPLDQTGFLFVIAPNLPVVMECATSSKIHSIAHLTARNLNFFLCRTMHSSLLKSQTHF